MSTALQNRLVGTIILVAVVVIFLPDLLDGKKESRQNLFVELPQKPNIKKVVVPETFDTAKVKEGATRQVEVVNEVPLDDPKDVQLNETVMQSDSTVQQDKSEQIQNSSLQQQTVVEESEPRLLAGAGWVVQLGSFRHQKNVRDLLTKLEKSGYRAFSRPVKTSSGILTKVFVGPELQKDKLEQALSHLKEITELQGRVTPFTVQ